jgi:hypothetical protein
MKYFILFILIGFLVSGTLANVGEIKIILPKKAEAVRETTYQDIINEIVKRFSPFGKKAVLWAIRCAESESGLDEHATNYNTNGTIDRGIMQINSIHNISEQDAYNYKKNIEYAAQIYSASGKNAWYGSLCF